jgi:hypothetical protein
MGEREEKLVLNKRGQLTIFIIIAIMILVVMIAIFALKGTMFKQSIPKQFDSAYSYYLSCIDAETFNGALLLEQSGGYIENPNFSPGSSYMPFSSQLNFLGSGVPYWYYISGNGVRKEQIPTKEKMQEQLGKFIKSRVEQCSYIYLKEQGYIILPGNINNVEVKINDNNIYVKVNQELIISYGNSSWIGEVHTREVKSNLGNFYNLAKKIYSYEKSSMFLENYGVDVLRLYAPVDGVNISCSPQIWNANKVRFDLINALEANVAAIKLKGDYYGLAKADHKYFVKDIGESVEPNINFMYSRFWPMKMEVWPSDNGLMKADPVGNQEGLGMLGFCYVPYHFVYDLGYPVMIQIYYEDEMFQFPVVVYIDKNKPREGITGESGINSVPELCNNKNSNIIVSTYNTNLEPIEADINFKCFDTSCNIGRTTLINGTSELNGKFPQCVNGFIVASALGYDSKKYMVTSLNENNIQIVLDKKYKLELEIESGFNKENTAVVTFSKDNESITVSYPEQNEVELTQGQYEIKVYVYSDSEINLAGSSSQKCVDVPTSGIPGMIGVTENKCFNFDVPDQVVSSAVSGGGKENYYLTESQLQNSKKIIISSENFGIPSKLEDLQNNYDKLESSSLDISLE